jgi:hypothetical protein
MSPGSQDRFVDISVKPRAFSALPMVKVVKGHPSPRGKPAAFKANQTKDEQS